MWPNENYYSSILKTYEHIIPINFNYKLYLSIYPDLANFGIKTENQAKQHYLLFGKNEGRICFIPNDFDPQEYKNLNWDLRHLSDHDLFIHYINNGYYEHRIFNITKINNLFDTDFYQEYYRTNSGIEEYINHGIKEGKYYNSKILDDNFDYGFYISYNNHFCETKNFKNIWDQFDALEHYLNNKTKNKANNLVEYSNSYLLNTSNGICFYVGHITDQMDIEYTIESLIHVINYFKKTVIQLSFKSLELEAVFKEQLRHISSSTTEYYYDKINIGYDFGKYKNLYNKYKNNIKKYDYICHINNSIVIYNAQIIKDAIDKFSRSNCGLYGLTDCYIRNSLINRNLYHLQSFFLLIPNKYIDLFYKYIISQNKTLLNNNKNEIVKDLEIGLSGHFIENDITIGAYCPLTKNEEFLWHNIMNFDPSLDLPYLEYNNLCVAKRQSLRTDKISLEHLKLKQSSVLSYDIEKNSFIIENIKQKTNIDLRSYNIALCCHIYDEYFYEEILTYLNKLKSSLLNIKYYITTNTKNTIIDKGIFVPNKGADLGPFILSSSQIIPENTDYFIKIHAKTHHGFRRYAISEIVNNIYMNIARLSLDNNLYALGSKRYILMMDKFNISTIQSFYERYNLSNIDETNIKFISGTMMVGNYKKYLEICNKIGVCLKDEYDLMENEYKKNTTATHTHAWERILSGIIPYVGGMRVADI